MVRQGAFSEATRSSIPTTWIIKTVDYIWQSNEFYNSLNFTICALLKKFDY